MTLGEETGSARPNTKPKREGMVSHQSRGQNGSNMGGQGGRHLEEGGAYRSRTWIGTRSGHSKSIAKTAQMDGALWGRQKVKHLQ